MLHVKDNRIIGQEVVFVITSHFTYGWIQECIESLRKYIPETKILVVDNNPSVNDSEWKAKSYKQNVWNKERYSERIPMCDLEKEWLSQQDDLIVLKTDRYLQHSQALDMSHSWLMKNSQVKIVVHVEPDCLAYGRIWFDSFVIAIKAGFWFVSGDISPSKIIKPTPSAYPLVMATKNAFDCCSHEKDKKEEVYEKIIKIDLMNQWEKARWDVGKKFFYEAAKKGKALYLPTPDFKHFRMGSRRTTHPLQLKFLESLDNKI